MENKATFSCGKTVARTGKRAYSHAWAAFTQSGQCIKSGFANSAADAKSSANWYVKNARDGYRAEVVECVTA